MAYTPQQTAAIQQAATAKSLGLSTSQYQSAFSKGGWAGAQAASHAARGAASTSSASSGGGGGGSAMPPHNPLQQQQPTGGFLNPSVQYQQQDPLQSQLDTLKQQYLTLQGQYNNMASDAYQPTYTQPTVPTPAPTPTPNQSTTPVSTTGVQSASQENQNLGMPSGPGGFTFNDQSNAGGAAPGAQALSGAMQQVSPDSTYNLWKTLNGGKDDAQMQAYFNSPDWAAVAAGNIPMYMANDNSWRALLMRLGYMTPSYNTDMESAIKQKLATLQNGNTSSTQPQ